jgi:hypothetical protein
LEGVKWIGLSIFGVLEHYNLINNLAKIKKNIIMLSIRYRPPFWNITRNNGTLHEIKGLQGVLGCFAKTKKNIIMLSMTYKNKNDYITKPVILGITQQGYAPRSFENWHRASLTSWHFVILRITRCASLRFADSDTARHAASKTGISRLLDIKKTPRPEGRGVRWII